MPPLIAVLAALAIVRLVASPATFAAGKGAAGPDVTIFPTDVAFESHQIFVVRLRLSNWRCGYLETKGQVTGSAWVFFLETI
jgi:hypothetical protein